jgi:hypothetical protein
MLIRGRYPAFGEWRDLNPSSLSHPTGHDFRLSQQHLGGGINVQVTQKLSLLTSTKSDCLPLLRLFYKASTCFTAGILSTARHPTRNFFQGAAAPLSLCAKSSSQRGKGLCCAAWVSTARHFALTSASEPWPGPTLLAAAPSASAWSPPA